MEDVDEERQVFRKRRPLYIVFPSRVTVSEQVRSR